MTDDALAAAVIEVERHAAGAGWDQPARLFALVDTAELVAREPQLADQLVRGDVAPAFTPIEQEGVPADRSLEEVLATLTWPEGVAGCAAVVERLVLPPGAEDEVPEGEEAAAYVAEHPDRQEVRIVAGALRTGASYCALRLRAHDEDASVLGGEDLVPQLLQLVRATLEEDAP
jgi:hypothetical protein